jgi:hypothetical protein
MTLSTLRNETRNVKRKVRPLSGIRVVETWEGILGERRPLMAPAEITGVLETATKLFDESQEAQDRGDWTRYFLRNSDAHSALLYLQFHIGTESGETRFRIQQLIEIVKLHRDTAIAFIEATVPKGEA